MQTPSIRNGAGDTAKGATGGKVAERAKASAGGAKETAKGAAGSAGRSARRAGQGAQQAAGQVGGAVVAVPGQVAKLTKLMTLRRVLRAAPAVAAAGVAVVVGRRVIRKR
jgi:hypothetical protein